MSPSAAWSAREPIREAERVAFAAQVRASRETSVRELETCAGSKEGVISESSVARRATELALLQCEYLQYRRRSIPPPITRKKVT